MIVEATFQKRALHIPGEDATTPLNIPYSPRVYNPFHTHTNFVGGNLTLPSIESRPSETMRHCCIGKVRRYLWVFNLRVK